MAGRIRPHASRSTIILGVVSLLSVSWIASWRWVAATVGYVAAPHPDPLPAGGEREKLRFLHILLGLSVTSNRRTFRYRIVPRKLGSRVPQAHVCSLSPFLRGEG